MTTAAMAAVRVRFVRCIARGPRQKTAWPARIARRPVRMTPCVFFVSIVTSCAPHSGSDLTFALCGAPNAKENRRPKPASVCRALGVRRFVYPPFSRPTVI